MNYLHKVVRIKGNDDGASEAREQPEPTAVTAGRAVNGIDSAIKQRGCLSGWVQVRHHDAVCGHRAVSHHTRELQTVAS